MDDFTEEADKVSSGVEEEVEEGNKMAD